MKRWALSVCALSAGAIGWLQAGPAREPASNGNQSAAAVARGAAWLASVQGNDGGWGQDGGARVFVRQGERLESQANDVANTAVAVSALLRAGSKPTSGPHQAHIRRGIEFILRSVEASPADGLAVTTVQGTQIQRKLGPFIDTFLTSRLLSEVDGTMGAADANARVRKALEKCVRKIEANQLQDGSWNLSGGWAPIVGTSIASQSLDTARRKGVKVEEKVMAKVDNYTRENARVAASGGVAGGVPGGVRGGVVGGIASAAPAAAGVPLYQRAQELEQLSRTDRDRKTNAKEIRAISSALADDRFVNGFGSMGGEEFFSYLNISESLRRAGGPEWQKWNGQIQSKLVRLQNEDGTWVGHHCITGRVAVTGAAILTLNADRAPVPQS
ncbi:MAG: prenyltransferase/squalene oxidase repeat-containing protein [Bryobacteraceae bacterium]